MPRICLLILTFVGPRQGCGVMENYDQDHYAQDAHLVIHLGHIPGYGHFPFSCLIPKGTLLDGEWGMGKR